MTDQEPRDRAEAAIEDLTELLDRVEHRVHRSQRVAALEERNRLNLLFGHAIFALLVAPGFALVYRTSLASPSFVVVRNIPGGPFTMATWIGAAGLYLAWATWHRQRRHEFYALGGLLLWYVTFSISLIIAIAVWVSPAVQAGGVHFVGQLDWRRPPALYAPVVYAHLAYAMGGHMRTLWKLGLARDGGSP